VSQRALAERSRTHPNTIARAVRGEKQISAAVRARIVSAVNGRRTDMGLSELEVSDIFPAG
jgi:hypothetical protein